MTLSFKTKLEDQTETKFVQRIWDGLLYNGLATEEQFREYSSKFDWWWWSITDDQWDRQNFAKIHTLREDKADRWKAGMPIHFVINNRRPDRLQFAPVLPCVSTQKIRIEKESIDPTLPKGMASGWNIKNFKVWIDDKHYTKPIGYDEDKVEFLAHQDGFMFDHQFIDWWPEGVWKGKIIHWTNFRYNAHS